MHHFKFISTNVMNNLCHFSYNQYYTQSPMPGSGTMPTMMPPVPAPTDKLGQTSRYAAPGYFQTCQK